MADRPPDLHEGFRDPAQVAAKELMGFLHEADRLPGIRTIQRAMRRSFDLRPAARLLDAGCGAGLEAARLAREHPAAFVTGVDRNAELLRLASRLAHAQPENLSLVEADLLMYMPDSELDQVVDELVRVLRPRGLLVLFELDYGGTILPAGSHAEGVVRRVNELLDDSLPQPRAGRRLPSLLSGRGLTDVEARPFSFAVNEPVWRRIVHDTLRTKTRDGHALAPSVRAWLDEQREAAARGAFVAAFTGILTTARRLSLCRSPRWIARASRLPRRRTRWPTT